MGKKKKGIEEKLEKGVFQILKGNPNKDFNYKQIAALLSIKDDYTKNLVLVSLARMAENKKIKESRPGKYKFIQQKLLIEGHIEITKSGSGYFISPDIEKDAFVAPAYLGNALHLDQVAVEIMHSRRGKVEARVKKVLSRNKSRFSGTIELQKQFAFFIPDDQKIHVDFFIPLDNCNGALNEQKVIVELISWGKTDRNPVGQVVEVLGYPGENDTEIHAILAEFGLPYNFPQHILDISDDMSNEISLEEIQKRRDFRDTPTFTIDPDDAKDFDDALSFLKLEDGTYEVGVHIADVSHYLQEGSEMDVEAKKRATSVYLVDRVVPMLPESLSNELCSLRPNEEKLCFSAVFKIAEDGQIKDEWFGRTIIESDRRFTYEEAQTIIEGKSGDFKDEILFLDKIAKSLRKKRINHGAIDFGGKEVKFELDESGFPVKVSLKQVKDSNQLIEEFMLLANKRVAEFVGKVKKKPFVYRIHDLPDPDKISNLKKFIKLFGIRFEHREGKSAASAMNKMLANIKGQEYEGVVREMALRCMAKAEYNMDNIGHYGLAFDYYTHFTSPIRRYPDVMVHRLLQHYLTGGKAVDEEAYGLSCKHSSEMERKAADAERASKKYMQVKFLSNKLGEDFWGRVTGLTSWGIYVELEDNYCDGMISLRSISDDFYTFNEEKYEVVGQRHGNIIRFGDMVKVKVQSADLVTKQIDFHLMEHLV